MKSFDRSACALLRQEIHAALESVAKKHNIQFKLGNATFTPEQIKFKFEVNAVGTDGEAFSKDAEDFKQCASLWGLKSDDLGKVITINGVKYKIVGARPRSSKFPIILKEISSGKLTKATPYLVKSGIAAIAS